MPGMSVELMGKKLYFVNAPAILKEYVDELWNYEIEAYTVSDFSMLLPYLRTNTDAILFFNFETDKQALDKLKQNISAVRAEESCKHIEIGLFSVRDLNSHYIELSKTLQIDCGYFVITDKQRVLQSILQICAQKQVKGRRKYIRVKCPVNYALFNCEFKGLTLRGHILDLSVAGMAVLFENQGCLPPNIKIPNIQLSLHGTILSIDGISFKTEEARDVNGQQVSVILFDPKSLDKVKEEKIHSFVRRKLQKEFEDQLNALQNT